MNKQTLILVLTMIVVAIACFDGKADDLAFKYGLNTKPELNEKGFDIQYRYQGMGTPLLVSTTFGVLAGPENGRKNQITMSTQVGIIVRPFKGVYSCVSWGPGAISNPDSLNGSVFQFVQDAEFGFEDRDAFIGIDYKHASNAGIVLPNIGRDLIQFKVGVRLF